MRPRPLRFSDRKRPFWLLVALAVMVLINVSTTAAPERSAGSLISLLGRDLGALRIHLDELVTEAATPPPPVATFNADIADGSPAFRARIMGTLMRSAKRRADGLIRAYAQAGRDRAVRDAQMLKIRLHELEQHLDRLIAADHQARLHNAHMQARTTLDRIELDLAGLKGGAPSSSIGRPGDDDAVLVQSELRAAT